MLRAARKLFSSDQKNFKNAICTGDITTVTVLLDANRVDVNCRYDKHKKIYRYTTPLFLAVEHEQTDILRLLIARGAPAHVEGVVDLRLNAAITPLILAIMKRNHEIADILIEHSSLAEIQWATTHAFHPTSYKMSSALTTAAQLQQIDLVKKLLAKGAQVNIMDEGTLIEHAVDPLDNALEFGNVELILLLLKNGARISLANFEKLYESRSKMTVISIEDQVFFLGCILRQIGQQKALASNEALKFPWEENAKKYLKNMLNQHEDIYSGAIYQTINKGRTSDEINPPKITNLIYNYLGFFETTKRDVLREKEGIEEQSEVLLHSNRRSYSFPP